MAKITVAEAAGKLRPALNSTQPSVDDRHRAAFIEEVMRVLGIPVSVVAVVQVVDQMRKLNIDAQLGLEWPKQIKIGNDTMVAQSPEHEKELRQTFKPKLNSPPKSVKAS